MPTEREYLVSRGLASVGRGRFSRDAKAELAKAEKNGVVFDKVEKPETKPKTVKAITKPALAKVNRMSYDPSKVRAWAKSKGISINDRGRVPTELVAQYLTDTPDAPGRSDTPAEFAIAAEPIHDVNAKWSGKDSKGKSWEFNSAAACFDCGYSLAWCAHASPRVTNGREEIRVMQK